MKFILPKTKNNGSVLPLFSHAPENVRGISNSGIGLLNIALATSIANNGDVGLHYDIDLFQQRYKFLPFFSGGMNTLSALRLYVANKCRKSNP